MEYTRLWRNYDRTLNSTINKINIISDITIRNEPLIISAKTELMGAFTQLIENSVFAFNENPVGYEGFSIRLTVDEALGKESYDVSSAEKFAVIKGGDCAGVLYGTFAFLRNLRLLGKFEEFSENVSPAAPLRMLNHWDNIDGSIERGYSGRSFFFNDDKIIVNDRTEAYARAAASVGINAVVINNVNVRGNARLLVTEKYLDRLKALGEVFARFNIKLFLSVNFGAPKFVGGMDTCDPCEPSVGEWWAERAKMLFENIPNFGGFLVKADSEGEAGPFAYGRDHADGANMLARAVAPYGGIVIWRCFVYNCSQDWRDKTTDRAASSYASFAALDGKFDDNVILQVKNGPVDFQIREPVHPLFGAMKKTNLMCEFQIAQEYTGQQKHVCCLIPMFKEILDFRMYSGAAHDTVGDIVCGKAYGNKNCGIAAVANTGDDKCWTGTELAAANFYGFGRMCFDSSLTAEEIVSEWCGLMFNDKAADVVREILMDSRTAYEDYTVPLGLGWMCKPATHYGPDPMGYEFDRWGTYNRADRNGVGVDRGPDGTGYSLQYNEPLRTVYSSPETCPDELKLFFCRLPYDYVLSSGKKLIQHIYDAHFEGYERAEGFAKAWEQLEGEVEPEMFANVKARFEMQLKSAREWRDIINTFFYRFSGIPDEKGRTIY